MKDVNIDMMKSDVDFYKLIANAYKNKKPFVAYRKPETNLVTGIFQKTDQVYYTKNYQESGFIFAPFDNIAPSILFPLSESAMFSCQFVEYFDDDKEKNETTILNSLDAKSKHLAIVNQAIGFLVKNNLKKVVLSRKEKVPLQSFEVVNVFKRLLTNYKNAFVYCWFHPKVGLWLGATPETLLKVNEDTFETMALAGTQVYDRSKHHFTVASECEDVAWQAKEITEQQYVTDFILEQLDADVKVSKPYTTKAGNLLHLRTDITGKLTNNLSLKKIIDLLHPTPAVCGVPKQDAKNFILENENYNRQYYTGFLGELNLDNTSNLFVNLRCMQVLENHIEIYIGGGITIDSNPQSEWEETVAKTKVMMKVL